MCKDLCLLIKSTEEKGRYAPWHIIFNASSEVDDSLFSSLYALKMVDKQFGFRFFICTNLNYEITEETDLDQNNQDGFF